MAAVSPSDRDRDEAISSHNGLEREFYGDVEVRRENGPDAVDDRFAIGLESVGCIVEAMSEKNPDEKIRQAVHPEFETGIVDGAASFNESAAKDTVVALVELFPVAHDVAAVVRFVRHHDDDGIAFHGVQPPGNRAPETVRAGALNRTKNRIR